HPGELRLLPGVLEGELPRPLGLQHVDIAVAEGVQLPPPDTGHLRQVGAVGLAEDPGYLGLAARNDPGDDQGPVHGHPSAVVRGGCLRGAVNAAERGRSRSPRREAPIPEKPGFCPPRRVPGPGPVPPAPQLTARTASGTTVPMSWWIQLARMTATGVL